MLTATVLILVMAIRKLVQRLGASRIAHRLRLNACHTRHSYGTPTWPRCPTLGGFELWWLR
jgi:hypothetical protein